MQSSWDVLALWLLIVALWLMVGHAWKWPKPLTHTLCYAWGTVALLVPITHISLRYYGGALVREIWIVAIVAGLATLFGKSWDWILRKVKSARTMERQYDAQHAPRE